MIDDMWQYTILFIYYRVVTLKKQKKFKKVSFDKKYVAINSLL